MSVSPGRIFVSYERGVVEAPGVSHACTLSFKEFQRDDKQVPGPLYLINDDTLRAGGDAVFTADFSSLLITLPITGLLNVACNGEEPSTLDVEQVRVDTLAGGDALVIKNPYEAEWVNYLQFAIKMPDRHLPSATGRYDFDLGNSQNQLVPLVPAGNSLFSLSMGIYNGRNESVYTLQHKNAILFAFVVVGAFELEGRLLHGRDGLALWDATSVELEALSNGAVLLLLEVCTET